MSIELPPLPTLIPLDPPQHKPMTWSYGTLPLTPEGLADMCEAWLQSGGASNVVDAYEAGFRDAEQAHGINQDPA